VFRWETTPSAVEFDMYYSPDLFARRETDARGQTPGILLETGGHLSYLPLWV
jgi:hypothetical protein